MLDTYQNREKNKVIAIMITLVVVVGLVVFIDKLNSSDTSTVATTSTTSTPPAATDSSSAATTTGSRTTTTTDSNSSSSPYKDGTYTATAEYYVPHGYEDVKVTLTIQNGTVTSSEIVNSEGDRESVRYQENFADSYKSLVVGKDLDMIQLSRVSGASDTTDGFNDALAKIRQQAQA